MKKFLLSLALLSSSLQAAQAQGLIGAPDESQRPVVIRLELERAKIFHQGLKEEKTRTVYGSIVWQLADAYESLNRWQDALAAHNTLNDLKLPRNAVANCSQCAMRATDEVIKGDLERLESKVSAIESVDHVRFDHKKRLLVPAWGPEEQRACELASRKTPLPTGHVMTLKQLLKHE